VANSVEIIEPKPNNIAVQPAANCVELSAFDVYTTAYFLSAAQTLEEHEEVGK